MNISLKSCANPSHRYLICHLDWDLKKPWIIDPTRNRKEIKIGLEIKISKI